MPARMINWMIANRSVMRDLADKVEEITEIKVKIEDLENSAEHINNRRNAFREAVNHLYGEIDALRNAWDDPSNDQATNLINTYMDDFIAMDLYLAEIYEFLRASIERYQQAIERIRQDAIDLIVPPRRR